MVPVTRMSKARVVPTQNECGLVRQAERSDTVPVMTCCATPGEVIAIRASKSASTEEVLNELVFNVFHVSCAFRQRSKIVKWPLVAGLLEIFFFVVFV